MRTTLRLDGHRLTRARRGTVEFGRTPTIVPEDALRWRRRR
jgi:hypothetical protein